MKDPCSDANLIGWISANAEFAGKELDAGYFQQMTPKQKVGYAGTSSKLHADGLSEDGSDAIAEQVKKLEDMGIKKAKLAGHFRDPLVLFGEGVVKPITEATAKWKQAVLDNGLTVTQGRELWKKDVVPVVKAQQKAHYTNDPGNYYQFQAHKYFEDLKAGYEVFGNDNHPVADMAKKGAGYFTGFAPHIAFYDVGELITKGMTHYGPWNFLKGMTSLAVKSKVIGAAGRMKENEALYFGTEFAEPGKSKVKAGAEWLAEHVNPQYYSNNLLTNGAAEIGRAAKVDPAEAIRKIGFVKEIGNNPAYLREGGAETVWARYSTEAVKFYVDIHADLGRAIIQKDPKAFTAAVGHVFTYHALMTGLAGAGASLPLGVSKIINVVNQTDDEDSFFTQMNKALPIDLLSKATGVDAKKGLQLGSPAFGLAFSALSGMMGTVGRDIPKAIEAYQDGDLYQAAGYAAESAQMALALKFRNPLLTKTAKNYFNLAADWLDDNKIDNEKPIELFTGKGSAVNY